MRSAALVLAAAILPLSAVGSAFGGDVCEDLLAQAPQPLWETSAVYEYLGSFDKAECPEIGEEEFEAFIGPLEVNLVSYALLESRLLGEGMSVRATLMDAHVQAYRDAGLELDENAVLPLIDIAYYECDGQAECIGEAVRPFTQSTTMTRWASCLYAMPSECGPAEVPPDFVFLNDATLRNVTSPAEAFEKRTGFICDRYNDCGEPNGTGRQ